MIGGITGHQNLAIKNRYPLTQILEKKILEFQITHGITCLANGADQMFAKILLQHQIPFTTIIPCHSYNAAFSDNDALQLYQHYKLKSSKHIYLPYSNKSEKAFYDAGKLVVDLSQILFAIWDGKKSNGLGGTADIVSFARAQNKPVLHIHSESLHILYYK